MFTLGIYKTREAAEAACKLWSDIYSDDRLSIVFTGTNYLLQVAFED